MSNLAILIIMSGLINISLIISIIFIERKKPESALGWIVTIIFLPFLGFIIYMLFGETFRFEAKKKDRYKLISDRNYKKTISNQIKHLVDTEEKVRKIPHVDLMILNVNNAGSMLTSNNETRLLLSAKEKFEQLEKDIENAKSSINLSYYIMRSDEVGTLFRDLLVKKASEGVEVRLLYDRFGSNTLPKKFFQPLIDAGGIVKEYFPTRIWFRPLLNHRNHRKMVIIDGEISYLGGINIGKEYLGDGKPTPWRDTHLKLIGSSSNMVQIQFFLDYLFVSDEQIDFSDRETFLKYFPSVESKGTKDVQIIASGPDYLEPNVRNAYLKMINNAKKNIYIQTPYYIPDEATQAALKIAVKSGVNVKLMIPGIPDKKLVYYVTLSHIQELLEAGIEVYLYEGFMHSKLVICDDQVVSIGSANIDRRSFSLNFELNAVIYDHEFAIENIEAFTKDIEKSKKITYQEFLQRPFRQKVKEQILRLFSPLL